jgi:RNA-dependent RNA polymerase
MTILDSRKSGLILKEDVFLHDNHWKVYGWKPPLCLGGPDDWTVVRPKRKVQKPFILEELLEEGKRIQDKLLIEFDEIGKRVPYEKSSDADLKAPWNDALDIARSASHLSDELKLVQEHVDACVEEWRPIFRTTPASKFEPKSKYKLDAKRKNESKKKLALAKRFVEGPAGCPVLQALHILDKVRASYAYIRSPYFAWAMGFQSLCSIKASRQSAKAVTADFANVMNMPASAVRVLSQDLYKLE